jgi:hypothetical protein
MLSTQWSGSGVSGLSLLFFRTMIHAGRKNLISFPLLLFSFEIDRYFPICWAILIWKFNPTHMHVGNLLTEVVSLGKRRVVGGPKMLAQLIETM